MHKINSLFYKAQNMKHIRAHAAPINYENYENFHSNINLRQTTVWLLEVNDANFPFHSFVSELENNAGVTICILCNQPVMIIAE